MNKKALDEKYSYQIDEHNVVHLFRGEDDCQQYLTNPLLGAIFKIETLEKENAELKAFKEKCKFNVNDIFKEIETENRLIKAKELLKSCVCIINRLTPTTTLLNKNERSLLKQAEGFLKENEEWKLKD